MSFNLDSTKQAQEVIFSRKSTKKIHPKIFFNNIPVMKTDIQKHLDLHLDSKLTFDIHIETILSKANRTIGLLRKLQQVLPRPSLITIYKAFIRPYLDYGDNIFDQPFNNIFYQRLESFQYNAALAITGAFRGTSKEKPYQELRFESLQSRRQFRKLSLFYKIIKNKSPSYLYHLIPKSLTSYLTLKICLPLTPSALQKQLQMAIIDYVQNRNHKQSVSEASQQDKRLKARRALALSSRLSTEPISSPPSPTHSPEQAKTNHRFFKNTLLSSTVIEYHRMNQIRFFSSYKFLRKRIPEFIRPQPKSIFNDLNSLGLIYLTRLCVGLDHLREHKFQDSLNPISNCGNAIESTKHYLLHCSNFKNERFSLLQNVRIVNPDFLSMNKDFLTHLLLYGDNTLTDNTNTFLLNSFIEYITSTKRFNDPLIL